MFEQAAYRPIGWVFQIGYYCGLTQVGNIHLVSMSDSRFHESDLLAVLRLNFGNPKPACYCDLNLSFSLSERIPKHSHSSSFLLVTS